MKSYSMSVLEAIPRYYADVSDYIRGRVNLRINRFVTERSVRIAPICDLALPYRQFEADFSNPLYGITHRKEIGLYQLEDVYVHQSSGLAMLTPDPGFWPIGIAESGMEDFQFLALERTHYRPLAAFRPHEAPEIHLDRPAFLFSIYKKKDNYYHFIVDNALRLVTFLEHQDHPVTILVRPDLPDYMKQFFALLQFVYGCTITTMPISAPHFRVRSPLLFMDDVIRKFGNFALRSSWTQERLATEPAVNRNGLKVNQLTPLRLGHLVPKSWKLDERGRNRIKNNNVLLLPSQTAVNCLSRFVDRVEEKNLLPQSTRQIFYISRRNDSGRGRNLLNEDLLIEALPGSTTVDFGSLPLIQQISFARNATILIGLHGAGLTNVLFMRKGAGLIEIAPAAQSLPASDLFENLAALRGVRYQRVFASPLDASGHCSVDPAKVAAAVAALKEESVNSS